MRISKGMKSVAVPILAVLLTFMMSFVVALADDNTDSSTSSTLTYLTINDTDKTITVTDDASVTTEIQDAINYIYICIEYQCR